MKNIMSLLAIVLFFVNNTFGQENGIYKDLTIASKEPLKVKILELTYTKMNSFPTEIFKMKNLEQLSLEGNKLITTIPKEIGSLTNLKILILYGLPLTELPKEIGNLTNLRELNLSRAKLNLLPQEMKKLKKLEELHLEEGLSYELRNNFPYDIIEELTSLKKLNLTGLYMPATQLEKIQSLIPEGGAIYCSGCEKFNENVPRRRKANGDINLDDIDLSLDDNTEKKQKTETNTPNKQDQAKQKIKDESNLITISGKTFYMNSFTIYNSDFEVIGNRSALGVSFDGGKTVYAIYEDGIKKNGKLIHYAKRGNSTLFYDKDCKSPYLIKKDTQSGQFDILKDGKKIGNCKVASFKRAELNEIACIVDYFGL